MRISKIDYSPNNFDRAGNLPSFKAQYLPEKFYVYTEKKTIHAELTMRKLLNKATTLIADVQKKYYQIFKKPKAEAIAQTQKVIDKITKIDESSPQYMSATYLISRVLGAGKEVEINIENGELQNITDSDEACIFIMNHDKQNQDSVMVNFFNALLAREYILKGKAETCPHPKVILNRDIVDSMGEGHKKIAKTWGAVGVDASIHSTNHVFNGRITSQLVNDLANDKINLFIFPEGRMCAFKDLNPDWKFQGGISDIIKAVAKKKDRVKVVPLGFAYNKKIGSIHIGEPLYFKKENDSILFTEGNVNKDLSSNEYCNYIKTTPFNEEGYRPILDNGNIVPFRKSRDYISGILCDNLVTCKKMAAQSIKDAGTETDDSVLHVIEDTI